MGTRPAMWRKRISLMAFALIAVGCLLFTGFLGVNPRMNVSAVSSETFGVYWDGECTSSVDSINWGDIPPGSSKTATLFIRNEVDSAVRLSLETTDWTPSLASEHMSLDWNYSGGPLRPLDALPTTLSLSVSPNVTDDINFNFDIVITASNGEPCTMHEFGALFAENPDVAMIYPADSSKKPLNCKAAMLSDWLASSFVYAKLGSVREGLDTDAGFVNQETGTAVGDPGAGIISFGGPVVNPMVKYAEASTTPRLDRAPIRFSSRWGSYFFRRWDGSSIPGADLPANKVGENEDMFVIEVYEDGGGRYIFLCYGFGWKGTYAAGKYFLTEIHPNIESYPCGWIIVKWEDANGDGFVNAEADGDAYTVIATGS